MHFSKKLGLAGALACLGWLPKAQAALQVALHHANTSVGILPTSTLNKWKLQTDPAIPDQNVADYIPVAGSLCNSYDPTKFKLAVNPITGNYALGDTAVGLGPFEVTSFDVQTKNGGLIDVKIDPTNPKKDVITDTGDVGGGESGNVLNIAFDLIPDRIAEALPAVQDQLFFELNLVQIGPGAAPFNPGLVTAFPDAKSFITIVPIDPLSNDPPQTTPPEGIDPSNNLPEPAASGLIVLGATGWLGRRRRKSVDSAKLPL
ncbi:MAG: PEP-CTERM sorting domain-containing protein [Planctomycetota bacterium]|nr:PEP-CTERM sorting domain-containing protein [Planctomycetota bacterium]